MKADRFDLEEAIVAMQEICDNIELLQMDGPDEKLLADIVACSLVHKLKYDHLWKTFLEVFELKDHSASYEPVDVETESYKPIDYESIPKKEDPTSGMRVPLW